jgi:hypothetical protein
MNRVLSGVTQSLNFLRTNKYASTSTSLFLVLYAGLAAPDLPPSIAALFEHGLFKFFILALVTIFLKNGDPTTAILVAIGFVISMGTLSRYRIFTMANTMARNGLGRLTGQNEEDDTDKSAFGPNGTKQKGPSDTATWESKAGTNNVTLRGFSYANTDNANHLPGGHGEMNPNDTVQSQKVGPSGYIGGRNATIGGPNSQL